MDSELPDGTLRRLTVKSIGETNLEIIDGKDFYRYGTDAYMGLTINQHKVKNQVFTIPSG